jgi:hypothetical protein
MKENQKDRSTTTKHKTYTMEELKVMTIKQMLNLNGLGTLKKNHPKAIQITGQKNINT